MLSPAPHRRRRRRGVNPGVILVVALLVAGAGGAVLAIVLDNDSTTSSARGCDVTAVAKRELPAVVTINAGTGSSGSVGSGEVIRSGGYILTNNHVVVPVAKGGPLAVVFEDGKSAPATIVGRDPSTDLAVLRVSGQSGLQTISIGNSSTLRIGQPVVALGSPLGLASSVTGGIVSALGRSVHVPGEESSAVLLTDAVQTDAAINPGNSGGALVNCAGALVGVPSAGATTGGSSGSIGLGFAIPVNAATQIANELISTGRATHAYIGAQAEPLAGSEDGQSSEPNGLRIATVTAGSPAGAAGLRDGDVIISIDGDAATSPDQLLAVTLSKHPGDRVQVGYDRDGKRATTTITLGREP